MLSAVLLAWRRPENICRIVAQLAALDFIDEILVWRNDPAVPLSLASAKARIIESPSNRICHGRFLCAAQARNPLVYVQDDDVLVHDVPALLQQFLADPTRVHFNLSAWHFERRRRAYHGDCHSALIGWGAIFRKDWLDVLDAVPQDVAASHLFQREADKYFTLLQRRHHSPRLGELTQLDGHSERGQALWMEPEHVRHCALATREALSIVRQASSWKRPPPWHVVITCHNYAQYLPEAVESVLQLDADYELTIVDDASTDHTALIAAQLCAGHPHVHLLRTNKRGGTSHSRNIGIASRDSAYVALLDADDRFGRDYLFAAGEVLARGADVANPSALLFGGREDRWQPPDVTTLAMVLEHNSVHYCSAFRRSWWAEVGGFDEQLRFREDYDFWIRLLARGARVRHVPGDHFFYRIHETSKTRESSARSAELMRRVRDKHRALYDERGFQGRQGA
jgi:GT2 family glycosyltransferase